jgi:aminopeptidase YwaD
MNRLLKYLVFALVCIIHSSVTLGQDPAKDVLENYYIQLRSTFNKENAFETVAFVEQRWRLAGNTGFNESIYEVEKILQQSGYQKEINGEADGPLTYRIEKRKMNNTTWEPIDASLTLNNENQPLLAFKTNRNMMAINSASTVDAGVNAEIVFVGSGTRSEIEKKNVKGKIVFADGEVYSVYKTAIDNGAVGVLAYDMPAYTQPVRYVNSIQFERIPSTNPADQKWGILLSYAAREKIKAALAKGKVTANVKIVSKIYASEELTIIANARGTTNPDERFVFSAHVQEPGANDNATGVGTLAEMARTTAELIQQKKFTPQRTITFLFGDEIVSTRRYITDSPARAKGIKWGLSLDMVGEDVTKTGGSFLIEKMPDPSAIWTRGKESHTEWGGSVLGESQMFPHYFNDLLINRCLQQSRHNGWVVGTNPFEGGSDHTPFLDAKIPGLLMWHFTDVFYHTDADRLAMVSAEEMKNVGVSALATAFLLSSASENMAVHIIDELTKNAVERLETEYELSKDAIIKGGSLKDEHKIIATWTAWYEKALATTLDINVTGHTPKIQQKIASAQASLNEKSRALIKSLPKSGR